MKSFFTFLITTLILSSCTNTKTELRAVSNIKGAKVYGDSIKNGNTIDAEAVLIAMKNESRMDMHIRGKVDDVCKNEGSWMTMKLDSVETMKITFQYNFKIDKDLKGKDVIMKGHAFIDTLSIEDQRHNAKDAGALKSEIEKITTPKRQVRFLATGVVVL